MALFVLSVVGSDRPGLTEALASAVVSVRGNWLESHLSRLGGLYVGSVLVELEADSVEPLRAAARAVDA
ncbi:MAG TPA: ACT domain-containing protein, partial [Caulobacteraceae bacterium]|nr:ACT domain-containing protein [Caulobacteraceae bacterium]